MKQPSSDPQAANAPAPSDSANGRGQGDEDTLLDASQSDTRLDLPFWAAVR